MNIFLNNGIFLLTFTQTNHNASEDVKLFSGAQEACI